MWCDLSLSFRNFRVLCKDDHLAHGLLLKENTSVMRIDKTMAHDAPKRRLSTASESEYFTEAQVEMLFVSLHTPHSSVSFVL